MTRPIALALSLLLPLGAAAVAAQSLGDVAEQERAKRKKGTEGSEAKAYTNDDLEQGRPAPAASPSPSPAPAGAAAASPATAPADRGRFRVPPVTAPARAGGEREGSRAAESETAPSEPASSETAVKGGGEEYWRSQAEGRRAAVSAAEKRVAEVQAEFDETRKGQMQPLPIDAMSQVPPNPMIPSQDLEKLQKDLAWAKGQLEAARKSLADLEDEARRAGVPPGWIR